MLWARWVGCSAAVATESEVWMKKGIWEPTLDSIQDPIQLTTLQALSTEDRGAWLGPTYRALLKGWLGELETQGAALSKVMWTFGAHWLTTTPHPTPTKKRQASRMAKAAPRPSNMP